MTAPTASALPATSGLRLASALPATPALPVTPRLLPAVRVTSADSPDQAHQDEADGRYQYDPERAGDVPRARQLFGVVAAADPDLGDVAARLRALR